MSTNLLRVKLTIEEKNGQLLESVRKFSAIASSSRDTPHGMEIKFRARCLERIYVLGRLAADNCFTGFPVAAALIARGVIETAGLLILFEAKIGKLASGSTIERLEMIKRFTFATKKFGKEKRGVHALDCVRALEPYYAEVELLYDILCEAVHPNWLGVSQFTEFEGSDAREPDEVVTTTVCQALLLGHKVAGTVRLASFMRAGDT